MRYKRFELPDDLWLIIQVFWLVLYYRRIVHKKPLPEIIDHISAAGGTRRNKPEKKEYEVLEKVCRTADFLLIRVLHTAKPCLPRSLTLFHWCSSHDIYARIIIGVKKTEELLEGHSWILLEDKPYREDLQALKEYTIMLEGNNLCRKN